MGSDIKYTDIMLDLETLGTGPNALILSIGAVWFNPYMRQTATQMLEQNPFFFTAISINDSLFNNFDIDASTLDWWKSQSDKARDFVFYPHEDDVKNVKDALIAFQGTVKTVSEDQDTVKLWGNGVTFDNMILQNYYQKMDIKFPVHYKNWRCFRTLRSIFPVIHKSASGVKIHDFSIPTDVRIPFLYEEPTWDEEPGLIRHHALHDAASQAAHVTKIMEHQLANYQEAQDSHSIEVD